LGQIFNAFVCKTRILPLKSQGITNTFLQFAITTEVLLVIAAAYFYPLNIVFGTRDAIFMHYGPPAIPFAMMEILVDEIRKYYIRTLPSDSKGKPHWFVRAALW